MKMTFRWYGINDSIPLDYIKQIPNMSGVVSAIYDVPPGEIWSDKSVAELKRKCDENGLEFEVIESIPVHEDIKMGGVNRDKYIENYCNNIRTVAKYGVKCICYNFMPVFDWLRTNLALKDDDNSTSLAFCRLEFDQLDPKNLHLPGWDESYSTSELNKLLSIYQNFTSLQLRQNLIYFLKKVIPVCEQVGVVMAIHPDDPPWDVFGIPRIVSTISDFDEIFKAVPSFCNGLTFCTGSLGASRQNDLLLMAKKYAKQGRIHFAHLRNILYTDQEGSFKEVAHLSSCGSLNMKAIVNALIQNGFDGYVRPDHGRNIFGENGKPGYGLYDRALGAAYLNGLFEALEGEK